MASCLVRAQDYNGAAARFRAVPSILLQCLGERHPSYATSLANLACFLYDVKEFDEGLQLAQRAAGIMADAVGPSHPSTVELEVWVAKTQAAALNRDSAEDVSPQRQCGNCYTIKHKAREREMGE